MALEEGEGVNSQSGIKNAKLSQIFYYFFL